MTFGVKIQCAGCLMISNLEPSIRFINCLSWSLVQSILETSNFLVPPVPSWINNCLITQASLISQLFSSSCFLNSSLLSFFPGLPASPTFQIFLLLLAYFPKSFLLGLPASLFSTLSLYSPFSWPFVPSSPGFQVFLLHTVLLAPP